MPIKFVAILHLLVGIHQASSSIPTVIQTNIQRSLAADIRLANLINSLNNAENSIDNDLFLYQTPSFQWIPSTVYRYDDFLESLKIMATDGVAGKTLYTGEDVENGHVYGMVNIAAFLAQSMKETIQYDACDENSVRRC
jgi:hypothetical protein